MAHLEQVLAKVYRLEGDTTDAQRFQDKADARVAAI